MSLQNVKVSTPTYNVVVPSTKQQTLMRPFKVSDEKVLMLAGESKEAKQMVNALKEVVGNCVENVAVDDLASFDLEYLFLKLRAVSVGETSELLLTCSKCGEKTPVTVNIDEVEVQFPNDFKNVFKINEDLALEMRYPQLDNVAEIRTDDFDSVLRLVASSVKTVYHNEDTYEITLAEIEDVVNILSQLNTKQFAEVQKFFEDLPKVTKDVEFVCKSCEEENKMTIEGLSNFF